jgi:Amt family ammonium transporter
MTSTAFAADENEPIGDPGGTTIGTAADIFATTPGQPTADEVAAQVGKNKIGINFVWVLLCGMLVFFFQAGFALVETGFTQAKNAAHTITMNFMVFLVGAIGYYLVGFAFQFGGSGGAASLGAGTAVLNGSVSIPGFGGIIGTKGFLLSGDSYDVGVFAMFFFQMVFMDTTCTIPTGSMAERVKFSAVVIMSFFISMVYYPLFGNWMWGGGWLSTLGKFFGMGHGALDFAGSSVVHGMGGMIALSGAIIIGPRIGKFKKDGTPNAFPGHHIPMAVFGTILLFFCWFAFNAGSTLSGTDYRLSVVAVNTMIAGAVGGAVAMFFMWIKYGKPDPSMTCNGALAGLVAITAPCAFVNSIAALIIGVVAGILVCVSVTFVENKCKIDDPVGAISVHGINGIWGILALGLFADGSYGDGLNGVAGTVKGLFFGDASQLLAQLVCVAVLIIWGFGSSYLFIKLLDKIMGIRVSKEAEVAGLDIPEMGVLGYPNFQLTSPDFDGIAMANLPPPMHKDRDVKK